MVITKLSLFDILRNRVVLFLGSNFHLGLGHFWDLDDHVVTSVTALERNIVPWRDDGIVTLVVETE